MTAQLLISVRLAAVRWCLVICIASCGGAPALTPIGQPAPRSPELVSVGHAVEPLSEASLVADLTWLTDPARAGRGSRSPEAQLTARWIAGELATAGFTPILQPIGDAPGQVNVIAQLGSPTADAVIVMAHYDHLGVIHGETYAGADDNASGVVVALAVARDLARTVGAPGLPGRVIFLFTGAEEIGLAGARAYVDAPTVPLHQIRAVYNLDMVGRNLFASAGNEEAKLAAVGLAEQPEIFDLATQSSSEAGLSLLPVRAGALQILGEARRSDDWIFRDHGVFAVDFSSGINDDYHRPTDTLDKVSRPQLVRMAKFLRLLVERTAR
ncbi:MAG: peptidase [Deltaproteobacteria bacterium]|nr:peptidase [Deltaproteobacteria bacterium]